MYEMYEEYEREHEHDEDRDNKIKATEAQETGKYDEWD